MRNSESAHLFTFINICKQVSRFIFNFRPICLLYVNNNNKYSYEKYINAKFGISTLVYLLLLLEISLYLNYKCGFYSSISLIQSGQTNTHKHTNTQQLSFNNIRALRSRSLRDGSLPHKGRSRPLFARIRCYAPR